MGRHSPIHCRSTLTERRYASIHQLYQLLIFELLIGLRRMEPAFSPAEGFEFSGQIELSLWAKASSGDGAAEGEGMMRDLPVR
jgi:hypothetical protein